ncbi:helix-turn-helix transcriptional regulator [Pseudofrankia sp. EUN1h]|uniref:helix-turn-helix transcriptional regulator n=1 Tax=Pseudofrankia sp. EUN1h TaxID=1834515 RepID=UPI0009F1BD31|nr:helix-turn-helix transcriptional regulator [Pseudofrankia sp. EUN1h]
MSVSGHGWSGHGGPGPRLGGGGVGLVGRREALELVDTLLTGLTRPAPTGAAWLLRGGPGIGKTALLDAAAARAGAEAIQVLRVSGVEFEADIGLSALHQMLYPLRDLVDDLPSGQRAAMNQVLGLTDGPYPEPLVVSSGALALLVAAASRTPVLMLVDDISWIDTWSATVLGFVARRIAGHPILFLAAARPGGDTVFHRIGLPELEVAPLPGDEAAALLDARHPGLAPRARERLLGEAAGNPLALLELPALLTEPQLAGREVLPAQLPLSRRLEALFASRVRALSVPTHRLLLIAALEPAADLVTVLLAAGGADGPGGADAPAPTIDDLAPAEAADLVRADHADGQVVFRHPLIRSAVVQMSSSADRRAAHRALARVLRAHPDRRAWHLAEAALGPDEEVADALEEAAHRALARGSAPAAMRTLIRAAGLTPAPVDRARRLAEAAYNANRCGQLDIANRLLGEARRIHAATETTGARLSHEAATEASLLAYREGDVDAAHRLLVTALAAADSAVEADWVNETLFMLLVMCYHGGRAELWEPLVAARARLTATATAAASGGGSGAAGGVGAGGDTSGGGGTILVELMWLCHDTLGDPARTAHGARERLRATAAGLSSDPQPWQVSRLCFAAQYVDALDEYRDLCRRMVARERDDGSIISVISGLTFLAVDFYLRGQWDESAAIAEDGLGLVAAFGYQLLAGAFRFVLAMIAAARGDLEAARVYSDTTAAWVEPRRIVQQQAFVWHARAVAALAQGDYEDAYAHAVRISPAGTLVSHAPHALWAVGDLVEAAVRTGRLDEARAHVAAAKEADLAAVSPRLALLVAGAEAFVADGADRQAKAFEAALAVADAARWTFDHARLQLAHGEALRRDREIIRARRPLREALETFDRLGARLWADRARSELRAAGVTVAARPLSPSAVGLAAEQADAASAGADKGAGAAAGAGPAAAVAAGPGRSAGRVERLTPQELQIAQLAATGLTNKQIGEKLFLGHRTVSAHLYRIFPKLGITSRAALRDALDAYAADLADAAE